MFKFIFSFATLALAVASAASYEINITSPVAYGDKVLPIGHYRVEIEGGTAIFKKGKTVVQIPVKVEDAAKRYSETQVNSSTSRLQEIHVGGAKVNLIFTPEPATVPAGGGSK